MSTIYRLYPVKYEKFKIDGDILVMCNSTRLKNCKIPKGITEIGEYAFCGCESIQFFTIPDSVKIIGKCAFKDCENIVSIVIPDSVEIIGRWVFFGCKSLKSIIVPDTVINIGDAAFENCSKKLTVYCNKGSYAEQYCINNGIKYVINETDGNK